MHVRLLAESRVRQLCSSSHPRLEAARLTITGCRHRNARPSYFGLVRWSAKQRQHQAGGLLQLTRSNTSCRRASANRNTSGLRAHITGIGRLRVRLLLRLAISRDQRARCRAARSSYCLNAISSGDLTASRRTHSGSAETTNGPIAPASPRSERRLILQRSPSLFVRRQIGKHSASDSKRSSGGLIVRLANSQTPHPRSVVSAAPGGNFNRRRRRDCAGTALRGRRPAAMLEQGLRTSRLASGPRLRCSEVSY